MKRAALVTLRVVALFYLYGAAVHAFNILGFSGFEWTTAPLKWQILDIVYLTLDLLVVAGLILGWKVGYLSFYAAAMSQIVLYTVFRYWIIDVPPEFSVTKEQRGYLTSLVVFHCVTIVLVTFASWIQRERNL